MSEFVKTVGKLLVERWNTPEFQFRLEHFVKTKRDRELLSHFYGWSGVHSDESLAEWVSALSSDPRLKNKAAIAEDTLKDVLIQTGCAYPGMESRADGELQNANRLFAYLVVSAKKMVEAESKIPASSVTPASAPVQSVQEALSSAFQRKLSELEEARDSLARLMNSGDDLSEKLRNNEVDLNAAKQQRAELERQVKATLSEIKGNLTTDLGDVEKAHNRMSEFRALITQRDQASNTVEGLEREISGLKRTIEEKKKQTRKDSAVKQQSLSQDIDILVKAAKIFGISPEVQSIRTQPETKQKKNSGNSRRTANQGVLGSLSNPVSPSVIPPTPSRASSSQFTLSEDQCRRINALKDGSWYGTKFGHAGVMRAASQDPNFRTNADFLQAMIDFTYKQKADQIPGSSSYGLLRDISAVRNRIASFPIWDGIWANGGAINPSALETFIQSQEQLALQSQAS